MTRSSRGLRAARTSCHEKAGLAKIRAYVERLGGKVEMIADFGDHRVVIG